MKLLNKLQQHINIILNTMKLTYFIIISIIFTSIFSSCNKNNNSTPNSYRPIKYTSFFQGEISESTVKYHNNRISSAFYNDFILDSLKEDFIYKGDSVTNHLYRKLESGWVLYRKNVYNYSNNMLGSIIRYSLSDTNVVLYKNIFKYEGDKLIEKNDYEWKSDAFIKTQISLYSYNNNNLAQASFYWRDIDSEEMVLHLKREFSYLNNQLYEELKYSTSYEPPIQLVGKKVYSYDDDKMTRVDEYYLQGDSLKLGSYSVFLYDNFENMYNRSQTTVEGVEVSSLQIVYEPGIYNYNTYYDVYSGVDMINPISYLSLNNIDNYFLYSHEKQ